MNYFRRLVSFFVLLFSCLVGLAQQNHFIYLQTENKQPFYVKMDKVIYNSTVSGYLIIPKLKEGNYDFSVGFVNAEKGEQQFKCTVARQDVGYIVKQFGDKGWGLFNLQTLQITMAGLTENHKKIPEGTTVKTDDFSQMLSTVVNDPAIKYEQKDLPVAKTPTNDSAIAEGEKVLKPANGKMDSSLEKTVDVKAVDKVVSVVENKFNKPVIVKRSSISGKDGLNLVYIDSSSIEKVDTIIMLIPLDAEPDLDIAKPSSGVQELAEKDEKSVLLEKTNIANIPEIGENAAKDELVKSGEAMVKKDSASTVKTTEDKRFLDIDLPVNTTTKEDNIQVHGQPQNSAVTGLIVSNNTSCTAYSNESDFLKLRKKMAAAGSEDGMLSIAKKAFRPKCYSTGQVKNLGVLFLDDASRYNFYDLAYPHVYDLNNFSQLRDQLKDEYYKKRLDAMLRQ